MSKPIEGCPQPDEPMRDRAWTAEQVDAMADAYFQDTEDVDQCGAMLRAFAATLRQPTNPPEIGSKLVGQQAEQAGGLVSDKLQRVYKAARGLCHGYDWNKGTAARYHRAELLASVNDIEPVPDAGAKIEAALAQNAQGKGIPHPDDVAVDCFAFAMKEKLAEARAKGRGGWQDKDDCPQQRLSDMLRDHVAKGDPRDVGNFAMFLHQRGESILPAQSSCDLQPPNDYNRGYSAGWDAAKIQDREQVQNAQGEAVAIVVEQDLAHHAYPRAISHTYPIRTADDLLRPGTKLYTHAERARVPTDAMLAAFVHTWNGGSEWLPSPMNLTKRQLARARKAYDAFLAAAPSQPEDANCSHTWVTDGIGPTRCSKCLKQPEDAA